MAGSVTMKNLKEHIDFFQQMYDFVRIVDPLNKRVIAYDGDKITVTNEVCYKYWKTGKICDNCVCVRAYRENKTFIKLDQTPTAILLDTAMPVVADGRPVVLELLVNATETMLIGNGEYHIGKPVSNVLAELNDVAIRDYLTSLYNRRFIDERLPTDIISAVVHIAPLSVIFLDVDHFKYFNDTYGHEAGDLALKAVGRAIRACIRSERDWAARYGGDEFLVCLNNTDTQEAQKVAERICARIRKEAVSVHNANYLLTVSFGVQTLKDTPMTADEMIRLADQKMYRAKHLKKQGC